MSEATHTSTRRRKQRDEARNLLKTLRAEHPEADRSALVKLYVDHVRPIVESGDDPHAIETLVFNPVREWVGAQISEPKPRPEKKQPTGQAAAAKATAIAEMQRNDSKRVDEIVARRLLEYTVMDGRALGDLTGADCRNLAERHGVFFHVLSEQLTPRAKVRNHFSELELQGLARHHKLIVA